MMGILDFLDFPDLVIVASMSPASYQLIMDRYITPRTDGDKMFLRIEMTEKIWTSLAYYQKEGRAWNNARMFCNGYECIFASLIVFCQTASKLHIEFDTHYHFDTATTQKLASYVDRYCSDVPQSVELFDVKKTNESFRFTRVQDVQVTQPEASESFALTEWFPQVEKLAIKLHDSYKIDVHLPNLTHFKLEDSKCGHFDLRGLAEKNPQIRSIELEICGSIENINEVNELFPNLESLRLTLKRPWKKEESADGFLSAITSWLRPKKAETPLKHDAVRFVRFRNVKHFTLDITKFYDAAGIPDAYFGMNAESITKDRLSSIVFDHLESFNYMSTTNHHRKEQIDYVVQYQNVTSLNFSMISMRYWDMKRLIDSLPKLKEITLLGIRAGDLLRLMAEINLQTLHIRVPGREQNIFQPSDTLPEQWFLHANQEVSSYEHMMTYKRHPMG